MMQVVYCTYIEYVITIGQIQYNFYNLYFVLGGILDHELLVSILLVLTIFHINQFQYVVTLLTKSVWLAGSLYGR